MQPLARLHDALTNAGAALAALCVGLTACIYTSEVVARHFLSAPLNWAGDVSSYLLCACVFLALPQVTRQNAHIAISYFVEMMRKERQPQYVRALALISGLACLATAGFVAYEGIDLFDRGVLTSQATHIPKWPIALLAFIGLFSAALHLIISPPARAAEEQGL